MVIMEKVKMMINKDPNLTRWALIRIGMLRKMIKKRPKPHQVSFDLYLDGEDEGDGFKQKPKPNQVNWVLRMKVV